jgi:hypothetical protein
MLRPVLSLGYVHFLRPGYVHVLILGYVQSYVYVTSSPKSRLRPVPSHLDLELDVAYAKD